MRCNPVAQVPLQLPFSGGLAVVYLFSRLDRHTRERLPGRVPKWNPNVSMCVHRCSFQTWMGGARSEQTANQRAKLDHFVQIWASQFGSDRLHLGLLPRHPRRSRPQLKFWTVAELKLSLSRCSSSGSTVDEPSFRAISRWHFIQKKATQLRWLRGTVTVEPPSRKPKCSRRGAVPKW